ncbi:Receptor-like protein 6 [Linum perenne]
MLPSLFPSGFGNLSSLTHLNLSRAEFRDPIPEHDISHLKKLVSLDLTSYNEDASVDMEKLVKNLTQLKVLRLDGVDLSRTINNKSCQFPHLIDLQLRSCKLYEIFPNNIFLIPNLQVLDVSYNHEIIGTLPHFPPINNISLRYINVEETLFFGQIPDSLGSLVMLQELHLSYCQFHGRFPNRVFLNPNLRIVEVRNNSLITGTLPEFPIGNNLLQVIDLSDTKFSGKLPDSIHNLASLEELHLDNCIFHGVIPSSINTLTELRSLSLSGNNFSGQIPPSLFILPALQMLALSSNQLEGQLGEFHNSSSQLSQIDLSHNKLQRHLPMSIFNMSSLAYFLVTSNDFSGRINLMDITNIGKLLNLLDLSDNHFQVGVTEAIARLESIHMLNLSNNYFTGHIPGSFGQLSQLESLDLSSNKLSGNIPPQLTKLTFMAKLNLSYNSLTGEIPLSLPNLDVLALSSNQLEGQLEVFHNSSTYLDLSNNNIKGYIPPSICYMKDLEILDLSTNHINGFIPPCLTSLPYLHVLSLRDNQLTGMLPGGFAPTCTLRTFDVNQNHLNGELSKSLGLCKDLEVVDAGKNYLTGKFPLWLENLPLLRILILHSNHFGGTIESKNSSGFPLLQIFDVSSNKFVGRLPLGWFTSWKEIINFTYVEQYPGISHYSYYQDSITVTDKGIEREYGKILTSFVLIDVSNNKFTGEIPEAIARLESIHLLNLSNNHFTGHIPVSFGQLSQLESLDLSSNNLSGNIPPQLTKLTFMSKLNLSHNSLTGEIPRGFQFENFEPESYEGNPGLCGKPLPKSCYNVKSTPLSSKPDDEDEGGHGFIDWEYYRLGIECGVGTGLVLGFVVAYLVFGNFLVHQRRIRRYVIRPLRT